jgi:hypothetical protein
LSLEVFCPAPRVAAWWVGTMVGRSGDGLRAAPMGLGCLLEGAWATDMSPLWGFGGRARVNEGGEDERGRQGGTGGNEGRRERTRVNQGERERVAGVGRGWTCGRFRGCGGPGRRRGRSFLCQRRGWLGMGTAASLGYLREGKGVGGGWRRREMPWS